LERYQRKARSEFRWDFDFGILLPGEILEPASPDGMPNDVLIVEDDPIIALDFEDMI
jgi:hypothetical protein